MLFRKDGFSCKRAQLVLSYHLQNVIVVYHVTIVAIGHGLLKKFGPLVIGCVLRTAGSSII